MGLIRFLPTRRCRRLLAFAGLVLLASLALTPAGALAAGSRRVGHRPVVPAGARALGQLAQSTQLQVTVTLRPRDPASLAAYAAAVATPGSNIYHRYLSVSEFARRFGPTQAELVAARASLRAEGLTPGAVSANDLSLRVTASSARLGSAFHTSFERYHLASGRTAFANTSAPQVTGSGASVIQGVIGLDNLVLASPQALARPHRGLAGSLASLRAPFAAATPSVAASAVTACGAAADSGGYTADQIASQYGLDSLYSAGDQGSGTTVALYELEPYTASDVSAYQSCYGTSATITNKNVGAGASCGSDAQCGLEDVLDIEDVLGLVPKARLLVYEGPNSGSGVYDTYQQIVSDNTAKVISTSWGLCEANAGSSLADAENTLFQEAATQGQSVFAAAGDSGTTDCTNSRGDLVAQRAVDDPASQPYVTGVGGTSLSSVGATETVWNDGTGGGAGGGGVSTLWSRPSYQDSLARSQSSVTCGSSGYSCREVPDISADADPDTGYAVYWDGGWVLIGGTSAAAPTWASLTALADASVACAAGPLGFANPALYSAAAKGYSTDFRDVTSGNNNYDGVTGFSAGTGYDMASGLGTPRGAALATALCAASGDSVTLGAAPAAQTSTAGRAVSPVTVSATSSTGATPIAYSASGLPAGLSIGASTGRIAGTPTRSGSYSVTVRAVDGDGIGATEHLTWSVLAPTVTLSGAPSAASGRVGAAWRLATLRATDGVGAPLSFTASGLPAGLSINHSSGVISGTPTRATSTTVKVTAADSYGGSAARGFKFVVSGAPRVSVEHASGLRAKGPPGPHAARR